MDEESLNKEVPRKADMEKGMRLKDFRKALPIKKTQMDFSNTLGISQSMLSSYENGIYPIPKFIKNLLEEKFRMNTVWLDTGNGSMFLDDAKNDLGRILGMLNSENQAYAYDLIKRSYVAHCHHDELQSL